MSASRSRERLVVLIGAVTVALAVAVTYGLLPAVARWRTQEGQLTRARAQVAQLRGFQQQAAAFEAAANNAELTLSAAGRRVIHAKSSALAASTLQTLLQGAAEASGLLVNRVDVGPDLTDTGDLTATMSAYGDIHGLSALLAQLARAPRLTTVERLTVQQNSALRGAPDVLQITIGVRAPVVIE